MVYTLSSPTALAGDVACHPYASELLAALSGVFRLTETGITHLGLCALDADPVATALAWGMVELVDAAAPSTSCALRATTPRGLPAAATLARTRLGDVRDVTRLVVTEAARWPDAPRVAVAGGAVVPASAAAAAAVVAAWWTRPDLPAVHAYVLMRPWLAMRSHEGVLAPPSDASYGPRGSAVADLRTAVTDGRISVTDLADVGWPAGAWARAMHAGARAAYSTGRLRAQLLAVFDVTAALVHQDVDPDPARVRAALPALHALAVAALVSDVLDPASLAELRHGGIVP
jgi:hypothetical protein